MFDDETIIDKCRKITERVFPSHQSADKVPVDCGSMYSLGISAITYNALKRYLTTKSYVTRHGCSISMRTMDEVVAFAKDDAFDAL